MIKNFTITGFSDEISPDIKEQFENLKKLGISHFEIRGVNGTNVSELTLEQAKEVKTLADSYGISVSSIGSPIGKIGINDDFEAHKELLKHVIKIAKIFGTKYIRIFSFFMPKDEDAWQYKDEVIAKMKEMVAIAEKEDIVLLHENEKGIFGDLAPRCKAIFDEIKSPCLKAVFDPANFIECGQETFPEAYDMLNEHVVYMHIKDAKGNGNIVPSGYGYGKIEEILKALVSKGYVGFLSLEPHLTNFSGLASLQSEELVHMEKLSGPEAFELAYNSLMKIIERM